MRTHETRVFKLFEKFFGMRVIPSRNATAPEKVTHSHDTSNRFLPSGLTKTLLLQSETHMRLDCFQGAISAMVGADKAQYRKATLVNDGTANAQRIVMRTKGLNIFGKFVTMIRGWCECSSGRGALQGKRLERHPAGSEEDAVTDDMSTRLVTVDRPLRFVGCD
ncbi:MAG TPA: hypothetical protein EYP14_05410 [Planctomycetaceae bacterium]|nr:hypothetical protein [Planctomycetaceae bacterium]